jgi:carnitine O-acetyltransferase
MGVTKKEEKGIPSWGGTKMIESRGDYREEAFLEQRIGGPLYSNQSKMPRLPIPSIQETLQRFLPTALPLARTKEEEESLKEACRRFPEQAKDLQDHLMARRNGDFKDSSWLQLWWNQVRNIL